MGTRPIGRGLSRGSRMDKDEISEHLKKFIDENDLTQEDFARLINAPLSSVSSWLHGKRNMSKVWQQVLQDRKILPKGEDKKVDFRFE
jgi:predicted transcriptional regulator